MATALGQAVRLFIWLSMLEPGAMATALGGHDEGGPGAMATALGGHGEGWASDHGHAEP